MASGTKGIARHLFRQFFLILDSPAAVTPETGFVPWFGVHLHHFRILAVADSAAEERCLAGKESYPDDCKKAYSIVLHVPIVRQSEEIRNDLNHNRGKGSRI